jgi:hypothetical protein
LPLDVANAIIEVGPGEEASSAVSLTDIDPRPTHCGPELERRCEQDP